ncbi:MAG: 8-oxo-dGTP diphosphatase MutT [Deltaproteobacteria bacterium]|nr:8-oxo-dGTP diphosphatase MutT [Deltaproteobacteria bacterium]
MIEAVAAVIKGNDQFLITKRLENSPMGHCWEFPGGKIEPGETIEECIIRECQEEIDVTVTPLKRLQDEWYDYPHGRVHLHFVLCEITDGTPKPIQCREIRWIKPDEFPNYEFPPADVGVIKALI